MHRMLIAALTAGVLSFASTAHAGETIDKVRAAGTLSCGVVIDLDDYSEADTHGNLSSLGADYCRAMAAEIFGDPGKARFLSAPDGPTAQAALRDGKIDVVFGATPNPIIGAAMGLAFGPPIFFDGQGVMTAEDSGIKTLADLAGRSVCFINQAPAERGVYDLLEPHLKSPVHRMPYSERGEMEVAFVSGHCDAMTGDVSWLGNVMASANAKAAHFEILPQTFSTDPFSPVYRTGDLEWAALIDWTVWALLAAEEHGVTQANAATIESNDPVVQRLTGAPWIARGIGLQDGAFRQAISAVGNYGEMYARDVTAPLGLPRGPNALAARGGLMWSLPVMTLQ